MTDAEIVARTLAMAGLVQFAGGIIGCLAAASLGAEKSLSAAGAVFGAGLGLFAAAALIAIGGAL